MGRAEDSERVGWWCGIASSVLILAGFFAIDEGGSEGPDAPISILVGEVVNNRGRIAAGSFVGMLGAMLVVGFAVALRIRLARAGPRGQALGLVAHSFGLVMTVGGLAFGAVRLASISSKDADVLAAAIRPLTLLTEHAPDILFWGALGVVATMSLGSFAVRLLPRAFGWVGMILVIGTVALMPTDHGGVGLMLFPWIIVACVFLIRGVDATVTTEARIL